MRSRWDDDAAPPDLLGQCVYASRLLGAESTLVLHGGGNTSVKDVVEDVTGDPVDVLYVKGSGWDLASIERAGFAPLRLARLRALLAMTTLSDRQMMNELRCASLDASSPDASVETLLHALLPDVAVLHSHADALIALTNQPDGADLARRVLGEDVILVPYVMPGFDLARHCAVAVPREQTARTLGIVLLNHGLFTFAGTVREAYQRHVGLISRIEDFLGGGPAPPPADKPRVAGLELARLRREVADAAGAPMILRRRHNDRIAQFLGRHDLTSLAGRGSATPDHVIRTKRVPLIGRDVPAYAAAYRAYFAAHARPGLTMLDPAPRVILDPALGLVTAGRRPRDADIAAEIYEHTIDIITAAEGIGRYTALPAADLFDVEYWDLEQAKLCRAEPPAEFTGEVALVTGAASGIGRACAAALRRRGAAVVALDVDGAGLADDAPDFLGIQADVTDTLAVSAALDAAAERFGGIDVVVAAAGVFPPTREVRELAMEDWRRAMAVNVDSVAYLLSRAHPYLALAPRGGRVVLIASKNVVAPGPGAAAYSASKAALTQLGRVSALEWAQDGIRVNMLHPDAVFDTGLWTPELLESRAARYALSVAEYKRRNLLRMEVSSAAVGELCAELCSQRFAATTGAQIPIDGGNDRVI